MVGQVMAKFFKQAGNTPVYIFNGTAKLVFDTVDKQIGYKRLDNPDLIAEADKAVAQQVGGISVCSEAEYNEFVKKKQSRTNVTSLASSRQVSSQEVMEQAISHGEKIQKQKVATPVVVKPRVPAATGAIVSAFKPRATKR